MDEHKVGGLVAFFTWLSVSAIAGMAWPESKPMSYWLIGIAVYIFAMWPFFFAGIPRYALPRLAVAWLSVVGLLIASKLSFLPILTVLIAGMSVAVLNIKTAIITTIFSTAAYFGIWSIQEGHLLWAEWLLWLNFHGFCLFAVYQSEALRRANLNLVAVNQQLVASQLLLGQAVKEEERARIFRDLHDRLGHLITALSVKLQLAEKSAAPAQTISESRVLCSQLLDELRSAVHASPVNCLDIKDQLNLLKINAPSLSTDISVSDKVQIRDLAVAEAILRISQEALSNTLKHSNASRFTLVLDQADCIELSISDNGKGNVPWQEGFGIASMKQRAESVEGRFKLLSDKDGCRIIASFPVAMR